jgi:hypothetical protein
MKLPQHYERGELVGEFLSSFRLICPSLLQARFTIALRMRGQ